MQAPPKDYAKWQELVRVVTAHLVQRYGADTVRGWYFEVWNEPDIDYWHGTPEQYWKLYDTAVAGVRATWTAIDCRLTYSRWRSVSTIAPTMATSRTRPATWKK